MAKKIIDVSQYNGSINWKRVDCDGVIIRIAFRGYSAGTIKQDRKFLVNIKGALSAGIPVGIYFMSQAVNIGEAIEEANYVHSQISKYDVALPIFIDSEPSGASNHSGRADHLSKSARTAICVAFCNRIEELGYKAGTYASTSWFRSNLDVSQLLNYYLWVAQYSSKCTATHRVDMWQYTSKGSIAGISGNVDISHVYVDFDGKKESTPEPQPDNSDLIELGRQHAINFINQLNTNINLSNASIDRLKSMVLQRAINLDYNKSLTIDGIFGTKSKLALGWHYIRRGEKQYMVTAAEILMYLNNISPNGVELPGIYGSGLVRASQTKFGGDGIKINAKMFLQLI